MTELWAWAGLAGLLLYCAFSMPVRLPELQARYLLGAVGGALTAWQSGLWPIGLLLVAQALVLLFIHWRVIYGHPHLLNWIRLGLWTPRAREHYELLWLQWRALRDQPLPEHPLKGQVQHLVRDPSMQALRDTLGKNVPLENFQALLSAETEQVFRSARQLRLNSAYWIGRSLFLQGQQSQDQAHLQLGASRMLGNINVREPLFVWKLLDAESLLAPYGLQIRAAFLHRAQGTPGVLTLMALIGLFFLWELEAGALNNPGGLFQLGGNLRAHTLEVGEYWRLVTSIFLHGSLLHIAMNGYFLYHIGRDLEHKIGSQALIFAFVLSGVMGSLTSALLGQGDVVSIGASGGLFGLVALEYTVSRGPLLQRLQRLRANLPSLLAMLLIGFVIPNVDNWAHLGGVATGLLLGLSYQRPSRFEQSLMGIFGVLVIAWGLVSLLMWRMA